MKFVEKIAKTVDDAVTEALIELGMTTDDVEIEVLEKGSKGIFGIGSKDAKVRVTVKKSVEKVNFEEFATDVVEDKISIEDCATVGKKFLVEVLEKMGIEANVDISIKEDLIMMVISGDKMGLIIGKRGEHLDALQYLVNLVVNKNSQKYTRVILDTENYRKRREDTLQKLAFRLAKKAAQTKQKVVLEPMNPYDRRIIHSALQNSQTVKTYSEGREPYRKVVILPNGAKEYNKE